ncbi:MAG: nucleotide exchange factor GrpE [Caulobacteraceae bacterium]
MTDEKAAGLNGAETDDFEVPAEDTANLEEAELGTANIDRLIAEAADWRDKALRAAADAENTRRRAERETNDARAYAIQRFARDLLDAADNLERALKASPTLSEDPAVKSFVQGVELTEKALQTAFERNGLKKIAPAAGDKFDPHLHQAMMEQPSTEVAPGAVIQAMQIGYELFGRVVRPAMVVVAAKQPAAKPAEAAPNPYAAASDDSGAAVDTKA